MSRSDDIYYSQCKECEHLYHCFGREVGCKISESETEEVEGMYLHPDNCRDFYPEV